MKRSPHGKDLQDRIFLLEPDPCFVLHLVDKKGMVSALNHR